MKICDKIFSELNLEPEHISPCCNVRSLKVPVFPYSGGPINMRAYSDFLQKTINELQNEGPVCRGCPELYETSEGAAAIRFRAVSINMHRYFCNCKCVYCRLWQHRKKAAPYDPLPALRSLKEQNALVQGCQISWGGGEPSILPTFDESCEWALENDCFQYIHTNALRFSPAIASALGNGKAGINISLDSSSPAIYEKIKGLNGFHRVVENLKLYAEYAPQLINLKYIVFEENNNPAEISNFLKLCKDLGVGGVQYSLDFRETNARKVSHNTLTAAAFMKKQADLLGLRCYPSFIDPQWQQKIDEIEATL